MTGATSKEAKPVQQPFKLRRDAVQPEALKLISEVMARRYSVIPFEVKGNVLRVAMANPADIFAIEALAHQTQMRIEPEAANAQEVLEAIDFNYRSYTRIGDQISKISLPEETAGEEIKSDIDAVTDAPVVKALTLILEEAVKARASDIHLQPDEDKMRVRYRIDGTLNDISTLPLKAGVSVISRIKIMADMNIADHHRPQDGQLSFKPSDRPEIDVRVGIIPVVNGEMAALRLLDKSRALLPLSSLGFLPECQQKFEAMLKVPHGMILLCGPTGAGKTTTLYSALNSLDKKGKNIITIEDPVEYRFNGINQIQVNAKAGLTFAAGLRSILRLDPNVILVGEIRDNETAGIAIQSALTGHLVLSSIHANDAIGVISRFLDLGSERFMIASALTGVIAQRMARRICPDCAQMVEAPVAEQTAYSKEIGEERREFLYGKGCKSCSYTGYRGRTGIFEILRISEGLRAMLLEGANASQLRDQALKEGMIPLMKDGMMKVKQNLTTPAEVLRVAYSIE